MRNQAHDILRSRYGHVAFRGLQEQTLQSLFAGQNTLLVMSTGSGKSLCYQIPAEIFTGLTVVVSPLIALIKDQCDQLNAFGFPGAYALHSGLSGSKKEQTLDAIESGQARLVFVTPERFRKGRFMAALERRQISLFVIDEVHCVSQWGHDFRPEYSRLGDVREQLHNPLTLALTATASPEVRADILDQLRLPSATVFVDHIRRPELYLGVLDADGLPEKIRAMVGLRYQFPGPAIFYFSLITTLYKFSEELKKMGLAHWIYHGDLPRTARLRSQEAFLASDSALLLATPAFGLGVDKPNIRLLVHAELPGSIEAYFQEVGRAGRDRQSSHCFLLYDEDDLATQMEFLKWANPDPGFINTVFRLIQKNLARTQSEGLDFLKSAMNFYNSRDYRVETTLGLLARFEAIDWPDHNFKKLTVTGDVPPEIIDPHFYQQRFQGLQKKLYRLVEFKNLQTCRKQFIYQYFGDSTAELCGFCDRCQQIL